HGMQEVGRPPSMPSPTRVPRCLDRPSLLARVSRPLIVARPSHSGLVTRTLAWFTRALAWFTRALAWFTRALAWFHLATTWFLERWPSFPARRRVSCPCLG